MPQVVIGAALGAAVGSFVSGAAFTTLFIQNLALGLVSKALTPKPSTPEAIDNTQAVKSPIAPRKLVYGTSRVGGTLVYIENTGEKSENLHMVLALASHEVNNIREIYFGDDLVYQDGVLQEGFGEWGDDIYIELHNGDQTVASGELVAASDGAWTTDHILNDIAYAYIRIKFNQDIYPNGIPNVSAVIEGKKVYDPRTGLTAFSNNPALCIADYLKDEKYGMNVADSELDSSSWTAAANLCDESVITSAGSQVRYTFDGVINTQSTRKSIIESMLGSMGGNLIYSSGKFYIDGASYKTPTVSLSESNMIDTITVQTRRSKRDSFNGVKGVFSSIDDNYIVTDYPAIISSTYVAEDGEPSYLDMNLPYTTDVLRAQRIAKLALLKSRKQISATVTCNLKALQLRAGDNVIISNDRLGWDNKVFEIVSLQMATNEEGAPAVQLQVVENAAALYDWTTNDEIEFVAGQPTNLVKPTSVEPVTNLSVTVGVDTADDGTNLPYADVSWTNNDGYATSFEVQYNKDGGSFSSIITNETSVRIYDVVSGVDYDIRVRAINRLGARSAWSLIEATTARDEVAPDAPTGLTATPSLESVTLDWDSNTESDLAGYAVYRNTVNNSATATQIAKVSADLIVLSGLDTQTRYYWVRAYDFSGNYSGFSNVASAAAESPVTDAPRSANGYIYYQSASATAPSPAPTVSGYNFANGTFSSITSGWAVTPPVMTAGDNNNYWYVKYTVLEQSYEGAQDVDVGSVLLGTGFTGLVTFTEVQSEVSDGISGLESDMATGVTTINGGCIETDSLSALSANLGEITAGSFRTTATSGQRTATYIGDTAGSQSSGAGVLNTKGVYIERETSATTSGALFYTNDKSSSNGYYSNIMGSYNGDICLIQSYGSTTAGSYILAVDGDQNSSGGSYALIDARGYCAVGIQAINRRSATGVDNPAIRALQRSTNMEIKLATGGYAAYLVNGTVGPFTASHDGLIEKNTSIELGDIVVDSSVFAKSGISDVMCFNEISSTPSQKNVIGVLASVSEIGDSVFAADKGEYVVVHETRDGGEYDYLQGASTLAVKETHDHILINAVGEGQINVCGENGDIEAGDLIVTSSIAGKGMRQSDDIVRGYTVAKSREAVTFSSPDEIKQIACIYLCG